MSQNIPATVASKTGYTIQVMPDDVENAPNAIRLGVQVQCRDWQVGDTGFLNYISGLSFGLWQFTRLPG